MSKSGIIYPGSGTIEAGDIIDIFQGRMGLAWDLPAAHNPDFLIFASAIVAPTNSFVHGNTINWAFLDSATNHGSAFFTSVAGNAGNKRLTINYPKVKYVFNTSITPDESFSNLLTVVGPTVALDFLEAAVYQPKPIGIRLTGAGTTTWTINGGMSALFSLSAFSTADGGTSLNIVTGMSVIDYNSINIQYIGPNRYSISRIYSGLGAFNARFVVRDAAGVPLATNPTTSDEVIITGGGVYNTQVFMDAYHSANPNQFMGTFTNFWVLGLFEAWMIVTAEDATSNWVRWQPNFPGATTYKIYRDTSSTFATQVLIHTGTSGAYNDTGLTTNTLYYYKLVAVVASVDTVVTTFRCKTK